MLQRSMSWHSLERDFGSGVKTIPRARAILLRRVALHYQHPPDTQLLGLPVYLRFYLLCLCPCLVCSALHGAMTAS